MGWKGMRRNNFSEKFVKQENERLKLVLKV